jgi:cytochrome P450 family 6
LDYLRLFDDLISLMMIDLYIETLRKYPPVPGLNRICTKDYKVPGSNIMIKKDTKVWIPVLGLQRDPEFYPDPEKFDPERFSEENKNERHPYTFIPFGEGPRVCIGTYILLYV